MSELARIIREEAAKIVELHAEIRRTLRLSTPGAVGATAYSAACDAMHSYRSRIDPYLERAYTEWAYADEELLEFVVCYLEVDPRYFRSGYIKAVLLTRLKRSDPDEARLARIRNMLVDAVERRDVPEFKYYCRLAAVVASAELAARVQRLLDSAEPAPRRCARRMLSYMLRAHPRLLTHGEVSAIRRAPNQRDPRALGLTELLAALASNHEGDRVWAAQLLCESGEPSSIEAVKHAYADVAARSASGSSMFPFGRALQPWLRSEEDLQWALSVFADVANDQTRFLVTELFAAFPQAEVLTRLRALPINGRTTRWQYDVSVGITRIALREQGNQGRSSNS